MVFLFSWHSSVGPSHHIAKITYLLITVGTLSHKLRGCELRWHLSYTSALDIDGKVFFKVIGNIKGANSNFETLKGKN